LMSISTIDSELRDRLDRLKINIRNQNDENERPQTAIKKVSNLTKSSFFNLKIRHQKCDLMKITSILQFIRDHRQHQPVQEMIDIGMGKGDLMLQRS
jgi:predicted transport protein